MTAFRTLAVVAAVVTSAAASACQPGTGTSAVTTVGGNGADGYSGDGGPATAAQISQPFGIVIGPDDALYVCEVGSHVIRRIDSETGVISTVAGTGSKGYSGNGGLATDAELNEPYELRFDVDGNMFFVEMQNHIVRKVDAKTKVISLVAGNGQAGFSGDGGPATEAQMKQPHSIALDDRGNLYVCDIGNHRIRRVDLNNGEITTFAGTGEKLPTPDGAPVSGTPLNGPRALDFDGDHSLVLALREGNAVYRIDLHAGTLHHLAGTGASGYSGDGGPATQALLSGPKGVCIAPNNDIVFADTESHTIRAIRAADRTMVTLVGDGTQGDGPDGEPLTCRLDRPHGVFVDSDGRVYIGDSNNHRVRRLSASALSDSGSATHTTSNDVEWIADLGGSVSRNSSGQVIGVDLQNAWITDADLKQLRDFPALEQIDLSYTKISDAGLEQIVDLPNVKVLNLYYAEYVTDVGVAHVENWKHLEYLNVRGTKVTSTVFEHVAGMTALRFLDVGYSRVSDELFESLSELEHLEHFAFGGNKMSGESLPLLKLLPALTELDVAGQQRTDSGLWSLALTDFNVEAIADLEQLKSLNVSQTSLTDRGIAQLAHLRELEELDLSGTSVTAAGLDAIADLPALWHLRLWQAEGIDDAAVEHLLRMENLVVLELQETAITDAGLMRLADKSNLEQLCIGGTAVSEAQVQAVQKALPECLVSWWQKPEITYPQRSRR